jgi:hypothetical protein
VIDAVTAAAFAPPGEDIPAEAALVPRLRASPAWIPELSLVAASPDGEVIGHVVCTRGTVGPAPALAPVTTNSGRAGTSVTVPQEAQRRTDADGSRSTTDPGPQVMQNASSGGRSGVLTGARRARGR